jgi:hypothetical protein
MNLLQDIITYVRRIIKSPSNSLITDNLIIDYINRFWIMDVIPRAQFFDFKTKYQFQTTPGVDKYNMPLYNVQVEPGAQSIGIFPVYQGMMPPAFINGIQVPVQVQKNQFYNIWPNIVQNLGQVTTGNGTAGPYTLNFPLLPENVSPSPPLNGFLRGHLDITGVIAAYNITGVYNDPPLTNNVGAAAAISGTPVTSLDARVFITSIDGTGANVVVSDSGWFLDDNVNYGLLITPGPAPYGNSILPGGYSTTSNTINYLTGTATVTFPTPIPAGNTINAQCFLYQSGLPRGILYYNNTITLRAPPDSAYLVEMEAYYTPAALLNTGAAIPYGYMSEYVARGAARKMLSDTGDWEQFDRYEPLFKEQETLVWKRSQRTWTESRTESIYSQGFGQGAGFNNNYGGGITI